VKEAYSSDDLLAFVAEVNVRRMPMVLGKRRRRLGGLFSLTEQQIGLVAAARKLHQKYLRGDYRHNVNDVSSMNELAMWLIEEHRMNEHLLTAAKFNPFTPATASRNSKLPPNRYNEYIYKVRHD
jgi:hypothetical protein